MQNRPAQVVQVQIPEQCVKIASQLGIGRKLLAQISESAFSAGTNLRRARGPMKIYIQDIYRELSVHGIGTETEIVIFQSLVFYFRTRKLLYIHRLPPNVQDAEFQS